MINDYEAIVLDNDVTANNILPSGRPLVSDPGLALAPGQPICHYGVITGETCGTVQSVNNGWFTMSNGVQSHNGDSGGPVYLAPGGGQDSSSGSSTACGGLPAAVSWGPPRSRFARISGRGTTRVRAPIGRRQRALASANTGIVGAAARNSSSLLSGVSPAT